MRANGTSRLLAVLLTFWLSAALSAQECARAPNNIAPRLEEARLLVEVETFDPTIQEPPVSPPPTPQATARVNPALLNKKVVVHTRFGYAYEGKLVEITDDALHLKIKDRVEKVPLSEVALIQRKESGARRAVRIIAYVALVWLVVGLIAASIME